MSEPSDLRSGRGRSRALWAFAIGTLVLGALWAYCGTFSAPFIFDDQPSISENPTIRHLWPLGPVLSPPRALATVVGRPLLNLSVAVNYAIGGKEVRGYHALNLSIHILAGLTLFGLARRTLQNAARARRRPLGGEVMPFSADRTDSIPTALAFAIALIWSLHPLQTESVTYTIQRAESLVGLFYLLTLYCFVRGSEAARLHSLNTSGGHLVGSKQCLIWFSLSWLSCLAGVATKEVIVTAPLMVFLYDRTFVAGTFREAWRQRWRYYVCLGATWLFLGYLMTHPGGGRAGTAGFGLGVTGWNYALTQCHAVVLYLKLSVWPHPLVIDYGPVLATRIGEVAPAAILLLLLLAGTAVALWSRPALGFLGAWFFVILGPSSSVVPLVTQTIAEHRMYLPLAAVVALGVCGPFALLSGGPPSLAERELRGGKFPRELRRGKIWMLGVLVLAAVFGILTARRNRDYRSAVAIWSDAAAKQPANARAENNLAAALHSAGRNREAIAAGEAALRLVPDYVEAHNNLGLALFAEGRTREAIAEYEEVLRLEPGNPAAHYNLGNGLAAAGRLEEAHRHWGTSLLTAGRPAEAIDEFRRALSILPADLDARSNLGVALVESGRPAEAVEEFRHALGIAPDSVEVHRNLGVALQKLGRMEEASRQFAEAARLSSSGSTRP